MTTFSPRRATGMVETRRSTAWPSTRADARPSCGRSGSVTSSLAQTLTRRTRAAPACGSDRVRVAAPNRTVTPGWPFWADVALDTVRPNGTEVSIFPIMLGALAITVAAGVPAAYLVAIYRYRLWDLDVVIRKAVVLAILAGFISLLYAGVTLLPLAV